MLRIRGSSLGLIALLALIVVGVAQAQTTGLDFPGHASPDIPCDAETIRFKFTDPHTTGLPIYGTGGAGVTYIWRSFPRQQTGFYTTFFWGNDDGAGQLSTFYWNDPQQILGDTYYGAHPFPKNHAGSGATHFWEIAVDNADFGDPTADGVVYGQWYVQVFRASGASGQAKVHTYHWNWPSTTNVVTYTSGTGYGNTNPPFPALTIGDAPWNPTCEIFNGVLRGFQVYNALLSDADVTAEIASPLSTTAGLAGIWYLNVNPTPTDIADKSGAGHHPAWIGATRPSLWTGPDESGAVATPAPKRRFRLKR